MIPSWAVLIIYAVGLAIGIVAGWLFAAAWYTRKWNKERQQEYQRAVDQQYQAYYQYRQPSHWLN